MERLQRRFTFVQERRGRGNPNMIKGRPSVNPLGRRFTRSSGVEPGPVRSPDFLTIEVVREVTALLPKCCEAVGFTYLIASSEYVKIGKSINLHHRAASLQSQNSSRLELIAVARGTALEQALHRRFERYRIHDEWFSRDVVAMLRASLLRYWSRSVCFGCALTQSVVDRHATALSRAMI